MAEETVGTFLCLRRGVSPVRLCDLPHCRFSLPTQRCFYLSESAINALALFSAYAEVFLNLAIPILRGKPFLCLRRGVSVFRHLRGLLSAFSLPTQRCFRVDGVRKKEAALFSAYAEVFPGLLLSGFCFTTFLCLRRGVSPLDYDALIGENFSLPTQRCFYFRRALWKGALLFSAYAEVFLSRTPQTLPQLPFLCLRRGVSTSH